MASPKLESLRRRLDFFEVHKSTADTEDDTNRAPVPALSDATIRHTYTVLRPTDSPYSRPVTTL